MKRVIRVLYLSMLVSLCSSSLSFAQQGFFGQIRADIHGDWGFDFGVNLTKGFGIRVGLMADMDRVAITDRKDIDALNDVLGNNYRLSYSCGPMVMLVDWLWISATAGYGEIGTYAYNPISDKYGVSGKIKGFETGIQFQFRFSVVSLEIGYGTIPRSFALGRPYHDITFGVGFYI